MIPLLRTVDKLFIAHEVSHADEAAQRVAKGELVVGLSFMVEQELQKRNIPHISLHNVINAETDVEKWWKMTHDISREWYRLPGMTFFEYRGIRIAEAPEPIMQAYLARLFYYARIFTVLKKVYPVAQVFIPTAPSRNPLTRDCLTFFDDWAIVDAARMAQLPLSFSADHPTQADYTFPRATWKDRILQLYNALVGLLPRRKIKIYSSVYWTHVAPIVPFLKNTELVVLERTRFTHIPWRQIIAHNIRIRHHREPLSSAEEQRIMDLAAGFRSEWQKAKMEVATYLKRYGGDLNWDPVLEACDYLIRYAPRVIADIETLHRIMIDERPNVVLQLASVGGTQHYFFLMARVASQLGIPTVELQHAGATIDPRSVFCRIETDYLLTYGKDVNEWHGRIGSPVNRLVPIGSPRFDEYSTDRVRGTDQGKRIMAQLGLDIARPILLAIVPFSAPYATALDSYELAEYYRTIRDIQKSTPHLQVVFKLRTDRGVSAMRKYLEELFTADMAVTAHEDLFSLLCASDAVICGNSTAIYQAILAERPLVLYPWKRFDSYHARFYERAAPLFLTQEEAVHAVIRIFSDPKYRTDLLSRQQTFLEFHSFDGHSSERTAQFLLQLAQKGK